MTFGTGSLAAISAHHDPILYLVLVFLHHLEEGVNRHLVVNVLMALRGQPVPQLVLLVLSQVIVRFEDGEIILGSSSAELVFPHLHLLAVPANHTAVVNRQCGVGDDQVFVDADNLAEALTFRTSSYGRIEREEIVRRFLKRHAVSFETHGEIIDDARRMHHQSQFAVAFVEGRLGRVYQSRNGVLGIVYRQAVDDEEQSLSQRRIAFQEVVDAHDVIVDSQS